MKIQFIEPTWVLKKESGVDYDFDKITAIELMPEVFEVKSINRDKHRQCSDIYLGCDNWVHATHYNLINVPNGLFKQINE